jgi:hypothetical protein
MKLMLLLICCIVVTVRALTRRAPAAPRDQVLGIVPRDLTDMMLLHTDWADIESELGLESLTSDGPVSDRWNWYDDCLRIWLPHHPMACLTPNRTQQPGGTQPMLSGR